MGQGRGLAHSRVEPHTARQRDLRTGGQPCPKDFELSVERSGSTLTAG